MILSGSLTGSGTISTVGGQTVELSGNESGFTGTWESTAAQTWFNSSTAGSNAATWVVNGSNFVANIPGGGTVNLGALSGNSGTLTNNVTASTATFLVGVLGQSTSFGGSISDKSGDSTARTALAKTGTGVFTVTGANTSSGGATVIGGTLQIGNGATNGQLGGGMYTIDAGARLYLDYATAVPGGSSAWSQWIAGSGTLELNSAQAVNGTAQWGPNTSSETVFNNNFNGTVQLDNGRLDATPAGLGGVSDIIVNPNSQFMAWSGAFDVPITLSGTGWGETGYQASLRAASSQTVSWWGTITLAGNTTILAQKQTSFMIVGAILGRLPVQLRRHERR